jgi:hypothetical protein
MNHEFDPSYPYNQAHWEKVFPLGEYHAANGYRPSAKSVVSPCDLAYNLQLRAEHQADLYGYISVPTDIFVFGVGEPEQCDITKINGLPFRPAEMRWPHTKDGMPFTFLAQFRFLESWDIVGPLPGDILLVFMKDKLPLSDDPEAFVFEWQNLDLASDALVQASEMPPPGWEFFKGFGVRHRTVDFPNAQPAFTDIANGHFLTTLQGTKIGGMSCNRNMNPPDMSGNSVSGQFLCSLGSICCSFSNPYPWVNHPDAVSHSSAIETQNSLNFGDGGSLIFHIDGNGEIYWDLSCN